MVPSLVLVAWTVVAQDGGLAVAAPEALARADKLLMEEDNTVANLQASLKAYDEALATGLAPPKAAWVHARKSMALFRLGDLASGTDAKCAWYKQGQKEAEKGIGLDPKCADAYFYKATNMGRCGEQRGVMQSLFMVKDVVGAFKTAVSVEPGHADSLLALAMVDARLPSFAGGSNSRAEAGLRNLLKQHPHFTRGTVALAELLADMGRKQEAVRLAEQVVQEPSPQSPGDWRKFDKPQAEALLKKWKGKQ